MLTIVIARHTEDVGWIDDLPEHCTVHLYNRGAPLPADSFRRDVHLTQLQGPGDRSGAYLHHLMHDASPINSGFTVFTSGDPFAHAPAWFELLLQPQRWSDVQPLSVLADEKRGLPPRQVIENDCRDWIGSAAIRAERFSLGSLSPMGYFDARALSIAESYRRKQNLSDGTNLLSHFLDLCGLDRLAAQARDADVGVFAHGAVFAVRNTRVAEFLAEMRPHLGQLEALSKAGPVYQHLFERAWLHLFGLPFMRFESFPRPEAKPAQQASPWTRVAALIDAVLTKAVPALLHGESPAAPAASPADQLRDQARQAVIDGHPDEAQQLLARALALEPRNLALLTEVAELAFQYGDFDGAVINARRALKIEPNQATCQFTLAMALAARGENHEALSVFDALMHGDATRGFRERHPERLHEALIEAERLHAELNFSARQPAMA